MDRALDTARVYQFADPGDTDYLAAFMEQMERHAEELDWIEWWYEEGQHIDWEARVAEEREDVRSPDSIEDMCCDLCDTFRFSLGGIGDMAVCAGCWEDYGFADQSQLGEYASLTETDDGPDRYVVVGCGAAKRNGRLLAREKYSSPYFAKKRKWAETFGSAWSIVSAKYGLVDPDQEIDDYDMSIEDVDVGPWLDEVETGLEDRLHEQGYDEVWVMVGKRYLDAADEEGRSLRSVLNQHHDDIYYPFEQTEGIGEQLAYLDECVDQGRAAMPYAFNEYGQQTLDTY